MNYFKTGVISDLKSMDTGKILPEMKNPPGIIPDGFGRSNQQNEGLSVSFEYG